MPRKKTEADYHILAELKGFSWLGYELPPNAGTTTLWQCSASHTWNASYSNIRAGWGCPHCSGKAPKTEADYLLLASLNKIEWIGQSLPDRVSDKTWWQCPQGHKWEMRYSSIQQGQGCPYCSNRIPKSEIDYQAIGENKGLTWIGRTLPPNVSTRTRWECAEGHQWEARYADIQRGSGCPYCYGNATKSPSDYAQLAKENNLIWLGPIVPTAYTKTKWQCKNGHEWETTFGRIKYGYGCPICGGVARKTQDDYHSLATKYGFEWVGAELPPNIKSKTQWSCDKGHVFEKRYNDIHNGQGCPRCTDEINNYPYSSQQAWICSVVEGQMNIRELGYIIDVVVRANNQKIAIEYDGWYWHKNRQEYDRQRDQDLIAAGWRVLRIKSGELLPDEDAIINAMAHLFDGSTYEEIILEDWGE
jgi:hypothetical protein